MNPRRAEDYNSWMKWVGVYIIYLRVVKMVMSCGVNFQKKCPDKFNKDKCEQEWDNMINKNKYSVSTLIYMLKKII